LDKPFGGKPVNPIGAVLGREVCHLVR
jgi:hypothetical protein